MGTNQGYPHVGPRAASPPRTRLRRNPNATGTAAEEAILTYARVGARGPRELREIASATGLDPIACGRALLALYDRHLLMVTCLGNDRFSLAPAPNNGQSGDLANGAHPPVSQSGRTH